MKKLILGMTFTILACAFTYPGCRCSEDVVCAYGLIEPGTWVLILVDEAGSAVPGATLVIQGQPERGNQLIPFEVYSGPGSLRSDAQGMVALALRKRVRFGGLPALDNMVSVHAAGFQTLEFRFSDIYEGRVGKPVAVAAVSQPATTTSARAPEPPVHCYRIVLRRKPKNG